jgi:phosphoglycolate phosphatase
MMPLLVFDLDGTLVETAGDLVATLNVILAEEGCPPIAVERAREMIGHGARALLERGLVAQGRQVSAEHMDRLTGRFLAHYEANIAVRSHALPGLEQALDELAGAGVAFGVCTNKLEGLAVKLLGELGLLHRFRAVVGGDTLPVRKPDAAPLIETIRRSGGAPGATVMVGDSRTDVDTARAAGVPVIVVDFGYTDIPPEKLGGDRLISRWAELPAAAAALLPRSIDFAERRAL